MVWLVPGYCGLVLLDAALISLFDALGTMPLHTKLLLSTPWPLKRPPSYSISPPFCRVMLQTRAGRKTLD